MGRLVMQLAPLAVLVAAGALSSVEAQSTTVRLHAAGSLREAFTQIAGAFEREHGIKVALTFGASGLLRERIANGEATDVFLTYCTNAVLARREVPALQVISLPPALAVGADYGLVAMKGASPAADTLADYLLGPRSREVLGALGFWLP